MGFYSLSSHNYSRQGNDEGTVIESLPPGFQLEISVVNGEKYKELCPDNTLSSFSHLRSCIVSHHTKALLRKEGGGGGDEHLLRCFLNPDRGQVSLSDLALTTSSEALLSGKAPTFRLLISAVGPTGEHLPNVIYVVSEPFVVATKRVKHAIKSDIPSIQDSVAKLVHIGKATMDKLVDLKGAAREEGFDLAIPDDQNRYQQRFFKSIITPFASLMTDTPPLPKHFKDRSVPTPR